MERILDLTALLGRGVILYKDYFDQIKMPECNGSNH